LAFHIVIVSVSFTQDDSIQLPEGMWNYVLCATASFSSNISMLAILESSLTLGSFKHCDFGILHSQSLRYQFHLVLVCCRCNVLFAKS